MENLPAVKTSLFFDVSRFDHAQRVSTMFSKSTLVPQHFRESIGNCMIALNYAERLNIDPIMLMQKMYIVHGRPGVEAQLKIALVNGCGRFEPLRWKHEGEDTGEWKCTAYANDKKTGKLLEFTLDWKTVEREGWLSKTGSKWKTMPRKMMQYRSGAWWADLYCPEVTLGLPTREELQDAIEVEPTPVKSNLEQKILEAPPELKKENQFICTICGFEAASKRGLAKHTTQSHTLEDDSPVAPDPMTHEQEDQLLKIFAQTGDATGNEFMMWYCGGWPHLTKEKAAELIDNFDKEFKKFQAETIG